MTESEKNILFKEKQNLTAELLRFKDFMEIKFIIIKLFKLSLEIMK